MDAVSVEHGPEAEGGRRQGEQREAARAPEVGPLRRAALGPPPGKERVRTSMGEGGRRGRRI